MYFLGFLYYHFSKKSTKEKNKTKKSAIKMTFSFN